MSQDSDRKQPMPVRAKNQKQQSSLPQKWAELMRRHTLTVRPWMPQSIIIISHSGTLAARHLQTVLDLASPLDVFDATITLVTEKISTPEAVKYCKVDDKQLEKVRTSCTPQKVLVRIDNKLKYVWRENH